MSAAMRRSVIRQSVRADEVYELTSVKTTTLRGSDRPTTAVEHNVRRHFAGKNESERAAFHLVRRRRYISACMTVYTQTSAAAAAAERSALAAARVGRNQYQHRLTTTVVSLRLLLPPVTHALKPHQVCPLLPRPEFIYHSIQLPFLVREFTIGQWVECVNIWMGHVGTVH